MFLTWGFPGVSLFATAHKVQKMLLDPQSIGETFLISWARGFLALESSQQDQVGQEQGHFDGIDLAKTGCGILA